MSRVPAQILNSGEIGSEEVELSRCRTIGAGGRQRPGDARFALAKVLLGRLGEVGMIGQFEHPLKIGGGVVDEPLLHQADAPVQVATRGRLRAWSSAFRSRRGPNRSRRSRGSILPRSR